MSVESKRNHSLQTESKLFLTGNATDERTVKNSLKFFGVLLIVFVISFIACASATFESIILRLLMNSAVIILSLYIIFNNGSKCGAEDVARGEILWQKQEKGLTFSESERKMCFHPMKGYLIGLIGSERILFGSDFPLLLYPSACREADMSMFISRMRSEAGLGEEEYKAVMGGNFLDFLRREEDI